MAKRFGQGRSEIPAKKEVQSPESDAMLEGDVTDATKVSGDEQAKVESVKKPVKSEPKHVPLGTGGQFVEIGGGVRISASDK